MKRVTCLCFVWQSMAIVACSSDKAAQTPPTPLERLGRETQIASNRALASASDALSASAETYARLDAEASAEARRAAMLDNGELAVNTLSIKGAAVESQRAKASAENAAAQARAALVAAQAGAQAAKAQAATDVRAIVDGELSKLYMDLQDWKMKVLHDPMKEATKAGMKAALPYEKALQTIEKRVADFEQRATGLSNQARSLRTVAAGMADAAVEKQAGGALLAAQQDMMNAHTMMNQATAFEAQGLRLIKEANVWNIQIPTYVSAASGAAHQKTWQYAKKLYAPPPISYGLPPPTPVFLQKATREASHVV
mmetsp:Transcript_28412/g.45091  ORF Transcript_28412/g.45091 Transcript_28412/m.45091 type:complete len:312 (-) Transcript_28412:19-954(-)